MNYEIFRTQNINEGTILRISIPVDHVDWNAVYTLESSFPDFIVPFQYQQKDDMVEFTYRPGKRGMLRYFGGTQDTTAYCNLFQNLLIPLQICGDWFMEPFCFVLEYDWTFYDSATQAISYLYVPSKQGCVSMDALIDLIRQVNNHFRTSNQKLENQVLRAIMDNQFQLRDFLQIFKDASPVTPVPEQKSQPVKSGFINTSGSRTDDTNANSGSNASVPPHKDLPADKDPGKKTPGIFGSKTSESILDDDGDDLDINLDGKSSRAGKPDKKEPGSLSPEKKHLVQKLFAKEKKEKPVKEDKPSKPPKSGKNNRKKDAESSSASANQIIAGAVAEAIEHRNKQPDPVSVYERDSVTVIDPQKKKQGNRVFLEYIGNRNLPVQIPILANEQTLFSIGRFDEVRNRQQSDFEFPADTKEVSRRHAVIEVIDGEYYLIDIGSMAGTFLNGIFLSVNQPYLLNAGDRVSFGSAGADYVFRK